MRAASWQPRFFKSPQAGGAPGSSASEVITANASTTADNGGNFDGDNVPFGTDVDCDGDGLIEIYNATMLNAVRYNLRGTGLDMTDIHGDNNTGGINTGCGGSNDISRYANGTRAIYGCIGYELAADLDLAAPIYGGAYANWEPIGRCPDRSFTQTSSINPRRCTPLEGGAVIRAENRFSARFDGNGRAIRNVIINASGEGGTGFFGAVTHMAELHNISLSNVNFFRGSRGTILNIGALVGSATGATITANNVIVETFIGDTIAGGLAGNAQGAIVTSNSVAAGSIISDNGRVGGLVGDGGGAAITFNSVAVASISVAEDAAGGLAGTVVRTSPSLAREIGHDERSAVISSNSVAVGSISGRVRLGGLIGYGERVIVASNSVAVGNISGNEDVGGLSGRSRDTDDQRTTQINVNASYVVANSLRATDTSVDGLIGDSNTTSGYTVTASYWRDITGLFSGSARNPGAAAGAPISADDLRRPTNTDFTTAANGIYSTWGNAWCNPATGEFTTDRSAATSGGYVNNRAWDFGTATEYPALTCVPFTPYQQRELARRALAGESFTPFPPRAAPANR